MVELELRGRPGLETGIRERQGADGLSGHGNE